MCSEKYSAHWAMLIAIAIVVVPQGTTGGDQPRRDGYVLSAQFLCAVSHAGETSVLRTNGTLGSHYSTAAMSNPNYRLQQGFWAILCQPGNATNVPEQVPARTYLHQNYPNPFNPSTTIKYSLARDCSIKIEIYSLRGERICTLIDEYVKSGIYSFVWKGADNKGRALGAGVYFCKMTTASYSDVKRMMLLK